MTSNETAAAVRALLESYLGAFERLDAAAIADHYAYPSHIASDAGTLAQTREGWRIAAIAHNQVPRLLDCLARRQSGA